MQARWPQLIDGLAQLGSVAFGFSDTQTPHMSAQLVKSNLKKVDEPVLIILDDMGKSVDLALLPVGRNSRILATSQFYGDWQDHFVTIAIQELSENDAFEIISRNNPPCNSSEKSSARAIVGFLGRLPVALTLVSQHILRLGVTYSDYLGQLQERPFNRLDSARNNWVKATNHDGNIRCDRCRLSITRGAESLASRDILLLRHVPDSCRRPGPGFRDGSGQPRRRTVRPSALLIAWRSRRPEALSGFTSWFVWLCEKQSAPTIPFT